MSHATLDAPGPIAQTVPKNTCTLDADAAPTRAPILVVEDSPMQSMIIQDSLGAAGFDTRAADSLSQAREWLADHTPELIVLDYRLPDGEGVDLIDWLEADNRKIPFVVTTARGSEQIAVDMMKRGALDYLIKDAGLAVNLADTVHRVVARLRSDQALKEARRSLREAEQRTRQVIEAAPEAFVSVDEQGLIVHWNAAAAQIFGYEDHEILGQSILVLMPESGRPYASATLAGFPRSPTPADLTVRREALALHRDGREFPVELSAFPVRVGEHWNLSAFVHDITGRRQMETQLVQSEKMASLGVMAAGVAHEINNPIGFVSSNLSTLADYFATFTTLLDQYEALTVAAKRGDLEAVKQQHAAIQATRARDDVDYIRQDVGSLLSESTDGLHRVKEIVQNLRSFARLDEADIKEADINDCLETTLRVVWNELKYKAQVVKNLQPLPAIRCYPGQLNQVFVNLLVNAAQAIAERGIITLHTEATATHIVICVADTGAGIAPENLNRLFTPFFTTKGIGKGTGLGLSISYGIVQKHNGTIDVSSKLGQGTEFTIRLPIEGVRA
ncbi:MAG: PAS domain S-box protein [Planctomycetaceae bacterium]|nr:PAS domain S-box protein [Planctomycetaceae bacterium]